ncbi:hypothetical protein C8P68_101188 [Mucilaginibacter yixingensis]|uniref:Uncharacterized protein n=1 Tax=Mucilaginibacter yixingensis TaxID=1295612 RepID=A0A2T5JEU7_9SPHI|nr:hypothetical protein [Mucilaginibacter yixingensis]PTR00958.1 hypothetical protein C8P68_101188 [Mucilaginibacter yixingensis]
MNDSFINPKSIKQVLSFGLIIYLFVYILLLFLVYLKPSRHVVVVSQTQEFGVIQIDHIKYPTASRWNNASLQTEAHNPLDYIFLIQGSQFLDDSLASIVMKLTIAFSIALFIKRFDFDSPFNVKYFKLGYLIFKLYIAYWVVDFLSKCYTSYWVKNYFHGSKAYQVPYNLHDLANAYWYSYAFYVAVFSTILSLYAKAINNRREIDLTI